MAAAVAEIVGYVHQLLTTEINSFNNFALKRVKPGAGLLAQSNKLLLQQGFIRQWPVVIAKSLCNIDGVHGCSRWLILICHIRF